MDARWLVTLTGLSNTYTACMYLEKTLDASRPVKKYKFSANVSLYSDACRAYIGGLAW